MSCVKGNKEVTCEETEEETNRRRRLEMRAEKERKRMERIRRICAGEDVEGVGEVERRKAIEMCERRKEKMSKWHLKRKEKETEEERDRRLERLRFNNLVKRVEETAEEKEERRRNKYFETQARFAKMTEEEREEWRKERRERNKEWRHSLSEEKRRRYMESVKRSGEKWREKNPEKWKIKQERHNEKQRERWRRLGEEGSTLKEKEREIWEKKVGEGKRRRLNQMKMYQQKRRLRKELEGMGEGEEEIERRLGELDKRLREELGIGPPKRKGPCFRRIGGRMEEKEDTSLNSEVYLVNCPASEAVAKLKEEVPVSQEEDYFCDFDEGPVGMPSPEEDVTQPESPSPSPPPHSPPPPDIPEVAEVTFSCDYCESPPFSTEEDLKGHLRADHLKICWKCPKCSEVMISSKQLSEHFKDVHKKPPEKSVSLPIAEAASVTVMHKDKSEKERKPGNQIRRKGDYFCMRCPWQQDISSKIIKVFKSWRELQSHVKLKHGKYYWPCEYCHLLKYSKQSLIVHLMLCSKMPQKTKVNL